MRARVGIAALVLAGAAAASAAVLVGESSEDGDDAGAAGGDAATEKARAAAERFLDSYVADDGRVIRTDQGGDTVSEGQAYAMLLAVAIGDRERFEAVWSWTRQNLVRGDGLLAARWDGGEVVDEQPASDADLDAARALTLAGVRFAEPEYSTAGRELGEAILAGETVPAEGRAVLVAGPWARESPATINASYFDPRAFAALDAGSTDSRWRQLAASSHDLVAELTAQPPALPPDWARIEAGTAVPVPPPSEPGAEPRYGFDAVRVPVRYAASCSAADRDLAAALWRLLGPVEERLASEHGLSGEPLGEAAHPASLVGAAAAAHAAGDTAARDGLLGRATEADLAAPTYYGAAWVALGRAMLTTEWLGGC